MKKLILSLVSVALLSSAILAQIIHVSAGNSIQEAINIAADGDTVLIDPGLYYENIDFKGKAITVASKFITTGDTSYIENTIIDGSQPSHPDSASVVYFISGEDTTSVLQGLTITGGKGTYLPPTRIGGGGILCHSSGAKILDNYIEKDTIINDVAGVRILGGGLYYYGGGNWDDFLIVENNKFRWNYLLNNAPGEQALGAAVMLTCDSRIIGNEIVKNHAEAYNVKAALYSESTLFDSYINVANNYIANNKSRGVGENSQVYGSGIYIIGYHGKVTGNSILYNESIAEGNIRGGAIATYKTDTTLSIEKNLIGHNTCESNQYSEGGGIVFIYGTAKIVNNIIYGNSAMVGGGISIYDTSLLKTQIINNTITQNSADVGGGIANAFDSTIVLNTILWDNTAIISGDEIYEGEAGITTVNYSNIQDGWPGEGNIDEDPLFVSTSDNDFHILKESPCAEAGIDSLFVDGEWYFMPSEDYENQPRPLGVPDIGADEWYPMPRVSPVDITSTNMYTYPNPVIYSVTFEYNLLISENITLQVFNNLGLEIETIEKGIQLPGTHKINWDASALPSGLYIYKLTAGNKTVSGKIIKR